MTDADGATRRELAVELLKAYRHYVGLGALVALALLWYIGPPLPNITITRPQKVALVAILSAGALGYLPAAKVLDWLYKPPRRYIVVLGLKEGAEPGLWELTPAAWNDVDVIEDELYQWPETKWPVYEAEAFNEDSLTAIGTWRGSKPDSELLRDEKELKELREEIEPQADSSIDTEITVSSRVREAVKEIGRAIIDEHASATTYEGERVADTLADIRRDVEEDTGDPTPQRNGEKPVREIDPEAREEAVDALEEVADSMEVPTDD